ncbi:site-specific integrase [Sphingopyxis sp.]|uniref:site-specific integrase n=1 Tax=Sphingopyxis sp. TaxID=1908224 RepID=UPI0025F320FD|nr:site-specific integrase [Sphingopyxis sp.]
MPGGRRLWTVLDDAGDVVECLRHWIVHLEQTHASPNTIRAYVRHVVDFANFLGANGVGLHEASVSLYDSFLAWRLARRKDALPSPRLILLRKQETRVLAPSTRNQIQLAIKSLPASITAPTTSRSIRPRLTMPDGHRIRRSSSISASVVRRRGQGPLSVGRSRPGSAAGAGSA